MEIIVLVWIACAIIGAIIGSRKGEAGSGFIVSLLLGPLGVVLTLLSSGDRMACPCCQEKIKKGALICPHCRSDLKEKQPGEPGYVEPSVWSMGLGRLLGRAFRKMAE